MNNLSELGNSHTRKLSELIRQGAKKRPQAFDNYAKQFDGQWCTCALGAAYEALTGHIFTQDQDTECIEDAFSPYSDAWIDCPCSDGQVRRMPILHTVAKLNDKFKWSREQIADYLQSQGY